MRCIPTNNILHAHQRTVILAALLMGVMALLLTPCLAKAKTEGKEVSTKSDKHLQSFTKGQEKLAKGKQAKEKEQPAETTQTEPGKGLHVYESQQSRIDTAVSNLSPETQKNLNLNYKAIQEQAQIINNEIRDEEELAVQDIGMLWQAAVERSATIRYAIEKLSRRDSTGKPVSNDGVTKRLLQSVTRLGGVAGSMMTGTPAGLLGSNIIEEAMRSDPLDPSALKVGDADMLLLAKEVEALQNQVIEAYYQYRHSQEQFQLSKQSAQTLSKQLKPTDNSELTSVAMKSIIESFYQAAKQDETSAAQTLTNARNVLGLLVGPDALAAIDQPAQK